MKKDDFFARVQAALAGADRETAAEILAAFETHFREGLENGKTEEEICEELGDMDEIEEAFREEKFENAGNNTAVMPKQTTGGDTAGSWIAESAKEGAPESIYNRRYPGIQRVRTGLIWADIRVRPGNDHCVGLKVSGTMAKDLRKLRENLTISANGGCLTIQQEKTKWIGGIPWRLFNNGAGNAQEDICIELELPEGLSELQANTISGDVDIEGISIRKLLSDTVSGDMSIQNANFQDCELNTKSGDINAEDNCADSVKIHTVSGDVSMENNRTSGTGISSISGDIRLERQSSDQISIQTTSGDIWLEEQSANQISIQTTSGDITAKSGAASACRVKSVSGECSLLIPAKTDLEVNSTSGDVDICYTGGTGLEVRLNSVSGTLQCDCGGLRQEGSKRLVSSFGTVDSRVKASTISGDITVRDER